MEQLNSEILECLETSSTIRSETYLNTIGAATYLELIGACFTAGTLMTWRCLGKGPRFRRIGRKVFYTKDDLDQFAKGQIVETVDSINLDERNNG